MFNNNSENKYERISRKSFLKHYGTHFGNYFIDGFKVLMKEHLANDFQSCRLEYFCSDDGFYWLRWNNSEDHLWKMPDGRQGMINADASSLMLFSVVAKFIAEEDKSFEVMADHIHRTCILIGNDIQNEVKLGMVEKTHSDMAIA